MNDLKEHRYLEAWAFDLADIYSPQIYYLKSLDLAGRYIFWTPKLNLLRWWSCLQAIDYGYYLEYRRCCCIFLFANSEWLNIHIFKNRTAEQPWESSQSSKARNLPGTSSMTVSLMVITWTTWVYGLHDIFTEQIRLVQSSVRVFDADNYQGRKLFFGYWVLTKFCCN